MAQENTIAAGAPGIASFAQESWGGPAEPRFGDGIARTTTHDVIASGDLDLPLYSVVAMTAAGVLALANLEGGAAGSSTGTITVSSTGPSNDETFTINGRVYTFKTTLTGAADEVKISTTPATQATYIAEAVNAGDNEGTDYGTGTERNADVLATVSGAVVTLVARDPGTEGDAITLAKSATNVAVSGAVLSGGDDDPDTKPFGILAAPVVLADGDSMSVPIYRDGHWNMDALNWHASYNTDASKKVAFEGSRSPGILVSKKKFSDDTIAV